MHVGSCCGHCSWSLGRVLNNEIIHVCGIFTTLYLYENMLCLIIRMLCSIIVYIVN